MQYNRLIERSALPPEKYIFQHMLMVADMDFLVIMVRRLLATAEQAKQIPSDSKPQLRAAVATFNSRWRNLTDIRHALEHFDTSAMFPVPAIRGGQFTFMWPGGNIELAELFEDARSIKDAIISVIRPLEAARDATQA